MLTRYFTQREGALVYYCTERMNVNAIEENIQYIDAKLRSMFLALQNKGWMAAKNSLEMVTSRSEFLDSCIEGAMEHDGYGNWMHQLEYKPSEREANFNDPAYKYRPTYAVIIDTEYDEVTEAMERTAERITVDHELIERGLRRIRTDDDIPLLSNWRRDTIRQADLTNDAGITDVVCFLDILEVAIFGEVKYT